MTLRAAAEQFTSAAAVRSAENCGCVNNDEPSSADLEELIDQASDVLCWMTGGRFFGRVEIVIRPCRTGCWDVCPCCGLDGIPLAGIDPVVSAVKIDGDALGVNTYTIHEHRGGFRLVKIADTDTRPTSWPSSQDLWRPDTADNTFSIVYTHGYHVDWITERAAIELVCYFAQIDQARKNRLPKGTVSANYNATTVSLEERRLIAISGKDSQAVGESMEHFLAVYGRGQVSTVWAPELEEGWNITVLQSNQ